MTSNFELTARDHQMDVYERLQDFAWGIELAFGKPHFPAGFAPVVAMATLRVALPITDFELADTLEEGG